MSRNLSYTLIAIFISLAFYFGIRFERFNSEIDEIGKPTLNSKVIRVNDSFNEVLYLTKKVWGISGNHQQFIISTKRYGQASPKERIILEGETPLFYKIDNNRVLFYSDRNFKEIPKITNTIILEFIEINDRESRELEKEISTSIILFE